jgi:dihydroorotate dehydrogenase electron transfer subunit
MKQGIYTITANRPLTDTVYRMELSGDTSALTRPGQFVNAALPGFYLRRPVSVCDWDENGMTLIYKIVGQGTKTMAALSSGEKLDLLTGLGNGFSLEACGEKPLLAGGGVGAPPLYGLAKALLKAGKPPTILLGFNTAREVFLAESFATLGLQTVLTTADGSLGIKGLVTDGLRGLDFDSLCACGPEPMLKALWQVTSVPGQYSFEARMACGFGACMGCSCETLTGSKRICKDGPVLTREEIQWQT